jgi:hypothetical protein
MSKLAEKKFQKLMLTGLEKLGAIETKTDPYDNVSSMYAYKIGTIYGKLYINVKEHTVFTRFEDIELYARLIKKLENIESCSIDLNKHSGKWNFHFSFSKRYAKHLYSDPVESANYVLSSIAKISV